MYQKVRLQKEPFSLSAECELMQSAIGATGARATFTGAVREDEGVETLFLEHYPGMTEAALAHIAEQAAARWPLQGLVLIHRIGALHTNEEIVLVITASTHRQAAFEANAFLMDYLKTEVPLWKQARGANFQRWVESTAEDRRASARWYQSFLGGNSE